MPFFNNVDCFGQCHGGSGRLTSYYKPNLADCPEICGFAHPTKHFTPTTGAMHGGVVSQVGSANLIWIVTSLSEYLFLVSVQKLHLLFSFFAA